MKQLKTKHKDLSKVDIGNDFRDFPQLYKTPNDIEKFIAEHKLNVPVLSNVLKLRKGTKLGLTPTEDKMLFEDLFDYIYDVFRVPVEETYKSMKDWLVNYIEGKLVMNGVNGLKQDYYTNSGKLEHYKMAMDTAKCFKEEGLVYRNAPKEINYFTDVKVEHPDYYNRTRETIIESFWIKTDRNSNQPVIVGKEAYSRVHVYPDRVYIFGCDDSSYTLETKTEQEAKDFAHLLKCAAPVWNFTYAKYIHKDLKFTN